MAWGRLMRVVASVALAAVLCCAAYVALRPGRESSSPPDELMTRRGQEPDPAERISAGSETAGPDILGRSATVWIEILGGDDDEIAQDARLKLVAAGAESVPVLAHILTHGGSDARWHAIVAAREVGVAGRALLPELRKALDDEAWAVRAAATDTIAAYDEDRAGLLAVLGRVLLDPSALVATRAALALEAYGDESAPFYLAALRSDDEGTRQLADDGLAQLSSMAVAEQVRALAVQAEEGVVRDAAARIYGRMLLSSGQEERLVEELGNSDVEFARAVARGIEGFMESLVGVSHMLRPRVSQRVQRAVGRVTRLPDDEDRRRRVWRTLQTDPPTDPDWSSDGPVPSWAEMIVRIEIQIADAESKGQLEWVPLLKVRLEIVRSSASMSRVRLGR